MHEHTTFVGSCFYYYSWGGPFPHFEPKFG